MGGPDVLKCQTETAEETERAMSAEGGGNTDNDEQGQEIDTWALLLWYHCCVIFSYVNLGLCCRKDDN